MPILLQQYRQLQKGLNKNPAIELFNQKRQTEKTLAEIKDELRAEMEQKVSALRSFFDELVAGLENKLTAGQNSLNSLTEQSKTTEQAVSQLDEEKLNTSEFQAFGKGLEQKLVKIKLKPGPKGDPGKDYVLTVADKSEIAAKIKVPVVKKVVVEKTEVVREQPIVTNEIKEVAKYETPDQLVKKLNTLEEKIEQKTIKGLTEELRVLNRNLRENRQVKGGGMGQWVHQSFSVSSSTTAITLSNNIAANGFALLAFYQGQNIFRGTHYTQLGKVLTLLFTPVDNTTIDITFVRT